jgi:choline dehydrogenase-like flavoprotein
MKFTLTNDPQRRCYNSPKVLMLSGIGDEEELEKQGIALCIIPR